MKQIITSILSILTFFSIAQIQTPSEFELKSGTPYEVIDGYKKYYQHNGELISVKVDKDKVYIQKFNSLTLTESSRIESKLEKNDNIETFVQLKDHLYLLFSRFDKKKNIVQLFAKEIDYSTGNWTGEAKCIHTVTGNVNLLVSTYEDYSGENKTIGFKSGEKINVGIKSYVTGKHFDRQEINYFTKIDHIYKSERNFCVRKSENGNKLLVEYRKRQDDWYDSGKQVKFEVVVFNSDLTESWKSHIEMPYADVDKNYLDITIDETGRVYILTEIFEKGWKKGEDKPETQLEVVSINHEDDEIIPERIEMFDAFISNAKFLTLKTGELVIAGYFGDKSCLNSNGYFIQTLSTKGALSKLIYHEFPEEMYSSYQKKNNDKLSELVVREIEVNEDGSWILYGEKFFADLSEGSRNNYFFQEVIATKISSNGDSEWAIKIPKNQQAYHGRMDLGYFMFSDDSFNYLLMVDNIKNVALTEDTYPFEQSGNEGVLTIVKIDKESGEYTRMPILDTKKFNHHSVYHFDVNGVIELSKDNYFFEMYKKGNEDILIKLTLN